MRIPISTIKRIGILTLVLCIQYFTSQAQEREVYFRHLTTKNGLTTNNISCLAEDSYGFLWIGTREGLYKFDGSDLHTIIPSKTFSQLSKPSSVYYILKHRDGDFWISTSHGLIRYNTINDRLIDYFPQTGEKDSVGQYIIDYIFSIDHQRVLLKYQGPLLGILDINTKKLETYHSDTAKNKKYFIPGLTSAYFAVRYNSKGDLFFSVTDQPIYTIKGQGIEPIRGTTLGNNVSFTIDKQDNLYFVKANDIFYFHSTSPTPEIRKIYLPFEPSQIQTLTIDNKNYLWVAATEATYAMDLVNTKLLHKEKTQVQLHGITYNATPEIVFTSTDGVWICRGEYVLTHIDNTTFRTIHYKNDPTKPNSLTTFLNYKIYSQDNYFIETKNKVLFLFGEEGVNYFCPANTKFGSIQTHAFDKNTIIGTNIRGVYAVGPRFVWFGSNKYLSVFDRKSKEIHHYKVNEGHVNAIYVDPNNTDLWFGDYSLKHYRFDTLQMTLTLLEQITPETKSPCRLPAWFVTRIVPDKDNHLWVATSGGIGRYAIDQKNRFTKDFTIYLHQPYNPQSIPNNMVWDIFPIEDGQIWVATQNGIGLLDTKTGNCTNYYNSSDPNSLSTNNTKVISRDLNKNIWIGTEGNGLSIFLAGDKSFKSLTTENGLPTNSVYGMQCDDKGTMWLSTTNGICSVDPETFAINKYSVADGLPSDAFNIQSYAKNMITSEILFGSNNGVAIFNPSEIHTSTFKPNVLITELRINNEKVPVGKWQENRQILQTSIWETKSVKLKYSERNFSLKFASLDYSAPEKILFKFRLKGFEKDWRLVNNTNKQNIGNYTNISPGDYTFEVYATNADGVWNNTPALLRLKITPPWWATWWFRIALFLFVAGSAYGFYRYRVNALKREKRILETKVAERTAELSEANAQLEERQEEILAQKEELETKNEQISRAYDNMQLLSDFGQKITATLNLEAINQMIYDYVSSLMDTQAFGIGIYNEKRKVIEFLHFVEDGQVLPYFTKDLASAKSLSVRCFVNKEEIVIGNLGEEYKRYLTSLPEVQTKKMPVSMVHLPLVVEGRAIGTLTVNSFRQDAYGPNELNNLRSLASYISIALDNASVYKVLRHTNEKVQNSIEYARTIQQAILPLREEMDKHFQSFVLFRPKDVVSGDFYWMQVVDGAIYFAVVDCTGHGVPGAFMSLIGSRLLDEIVKEKGIRQPSQILETLDHELGIALRQGDTENNDGMDICLIKLEYGKEAEEKTWTLTFSGAMRPLYLVQGGELKQLKGDRRSIGGKRTIRKTVIAFTDQSQVLAAGTTLYLSSDGFADQNNGTHDKFGVIALEKLLTVMAPQPLDNQLNQLNNALDTHMGHEEQRDDITVVGINF